MKTEKTEYIEIRGAKHFRHKNWKTILRVNANNIGIAITLLEWVRKQDLDLYFKIFRVTKTVKEKEINL